MPVQLRAPARRGRARGRPRQPNPAGAWKMVAIRLIGGAIALWGLLSLIGLLVTHVLAHGPVHSLDRGVGVWFAAQRTADWNRITAFGTDLARTQTLIAVVLVLVLVLRWQLVRWHESLRLDHALPTSSFPSGHTAAAVALYGCIALLLVRIYGHRPATRAAVAAACAIAIAVALSRLYRGMHYPTDVLAGALTGGLWLLIVFSTLRGTRIRRVSPQ